MSLRLESQYGNEVLVKQKLCQDIGPFVQTNIFLSDSVNYVYAFVFVA